LVDATRAKQKTVTIAVIPHVDPSSSPPHDNTYAGAPHAWTWLAQAAAQATHIGTSAHTSCIAIEDTLVRSGTNCTAASQIAVCNRCKWGPLTRSATHDLHSAIVPEYGLSTTHNIGSQVASENGKALLESCSCECPSWRSILDLKLVSVRWNTDTVPSPFSVVNLKPVRYSYVGNELSDRFLGSKRRLDSRLETQPEM
jgi:hypothetical protein